MLFPLKLQLQITKGTPQLPSLHTTMASVVTIKGITQMIHCLLDFGAKQKFRYQLPNFFSMVLNQNIIVRRSTIAFMRLLTLYPGKDQRLLERLDRTRVN